MTLDIGTRIAVYWLEDDEWYKGTITAFKSYDNNVVHIDYDDGENEWIDIKANDIKISSDSDPLSKNDTTIQLKRISKLIIGSRISVWWPAEKEYYIGILNEIDDSNSKLPHHIIYDDGQEECTNLLYRKFTLVRRYCVFCSIETWDSVARKKAERAFIKLMAEKGRKSSKKIGQCRRRRRHYYVVPQIENDKWMICNKCDSSVCQRCAYRIPEMMKSDGFNRNNSIFVATCEAFLASSQNIYKVDEDKSHCCRFHQKLKSTLNNGDYSFTDLRLDIDMGDSNKENDGVHILPTVKDDLEHTLFPPKKILVGISNGTKKSLDGSFYFPEYDVLIEATLKYTEIVGVSPQTDPIKVPGPLHSVIDAIFGNLCLIMGWCPKMDSKNRIADFHVTINVKHPIYGIKIELKVRITILKHNGSSPKKGSNMATKEQVENSRLIMTDYQCDQTIKNNKTDLWLVLGEPKGRNKEDKHEGDLFLLTGRFLMYKVENLLEPKEDNILFQYLTDTLPRDGLSVERVGGSNGTDEDIDLKALNRLMKYHGSTPRKSYGVVWELKDRNCCVYYVNPYEKKYTVTKHLRYAIPIRAGQIQFNRNNLKQAPQCLFKMMSATVLTKQMAVVAIDAINTLVSDNVSKNGDGWQQFIERKNFNLPNKNVLIVREAVMVEKLNHSHIMKQYCQIGNEVEMDGNTFSNIICHHAMSTKTSIVPTALRCHEDHTRTHPILKKKTSFLEAKIIRSVPERSVRPIEPNGFINLARGRGVGIPGLFSYSFLDHGFFEVMEQPWFQFQQHHHLQQLTLRDFMGYVNHNIPVQVNNPQNLQIARARYNNNFQRRAQRIERDRVGRARGARRRRRAARRNN